MTNGSSSTAPAPTGAGLAFAYVTTLFFAWGFVTSLIDPLIAAVRRVFELSLAEAMLTASAWFIAYGAASLPAAWILSRLGYSRAIIAALATMVLGCLIVPVATTLDWYPGVLVALFVIASGVTLLQVAANPLSAALGSPTSAAFRLTLSQAFNSLGTTLAPIVGSTVLLTGGVFAAGAVVTVATRGSSLRSIDFAFLAVGLFFAVVAVFIWTARKRITEAAAGSPIEVVSPLTAFRSKWAMFGALAIFLYVGSEVSIGGLLIPFLSQGDILGVPEASAGHMVGLYWGGAMIGRFIGSLVLTRVKPGVVLSVCTIAAALLAAVVTQTSGSTAAYAALGIGLFNSIMFPTIFTLTLERSSAPTSATSGLLVFGIIGGAILPLAAGKIADVAGSVTPAFVIPLIGYACLTIFAIACARTRPRIVDIATGGVGH